MASNEMMQYIGSGSPEAPKGGYRDTRSPVRLGILVLIIGFGSFLLWSAFAPLDEGVPCSGTVSIATKSKAIEHLFGGKVAAVYVHEGQMVEKGAPLIALDSTAVKARYDEMHHRYLGIRATEGRLLAEMRGTSGIPFHTDLLRDPDRALARTHKENQQSLFEARTTTRRILQEQLEGVRALVSDGYAPLSQQRELELKLADIKSSTASQLAQIQLEVEADAEKTRALRRELDDTRMYAPVAGQVVDLQVQSAGSVVRPGEKLMEVVPIEESLLIDVKVQPHLIDSIHKGLPVDVSFSGFAHNPSLVAEGEVVSVSKDIVTDPRLNPLMPQANYYLARVVLTKQGLKALGHNQMQPGMPVQVVVKTGERSLLTYLVNPLFKRISMSMKEE